MRQHVLFHVSFGGEGALTQHALEWSFLRMTAVVDVERAATSKRLVADAARRVWSPRCRFERRRRKTDDVEATLDCRRLIRRRQTDRRSDGAVQAGRRRRRRRGMVSAVDTRLRRRRGALGPLNDALHLFQRVAARRR